MGTRFKGTRQQVGSLDAYIKLMRAADSATTRIHRHLTPAKLTVSQFGVLEALYHIGPLCQRELGQKILKSSGNMTTVVDNLEKRGLVLRKRSLQDRRLLHVHLTAQGHKLIEGLFPRHAARVVEEMSALNAAEMAELGRLCRKLGLGNEKPE